MFWDHFGELYSERVLKKLTKKYCWNGAKWYKISIYWQFMANSPTFVYLKKYTSKYWSDKCVFQSLQIWLLFYDTLTVIVDWRFWLAWEESATDRKDYETLLMTNFFEEVLLLMFKSQCAVNSEWLQNEKTWLDLSNICQRNRQRGQELLNQQCHPRQRSSRFDFFAMGPDTRLCW